MRLLDAGRLHAVSAMVGGAAWPDGARALRARARTDVDVGLHLDLTACPLRAGSRQPLNVQVLRSLCRWTDPAALRREIEAQLAAFEAAMDCAPAHVDGHQHVHQLPGVREVLLAVLDERYGPARPWLRSTRASGLGETSPKAWLIEQLGEAGLRAAAERRGFGHNAHLLGVWNFHGGPARYRALLGAWLRQAGDGDLLMCHPGLGTDASDAIAAARHAEFSVLSDRFVPQWVDTLRLRLGPLSRWIAAR